MSRARRRERDARRAFPHDVQETTVPKTKEYKFTLNTPNGPIQLGVPEDGMRICPCGCDMFRQSFRVAFVTPKGVLGAEPVPLAAPAWICEECDRELLPSDLTKMEAKALKPHVLETAN